MHIMYSIVIDIRAKIVIVEGLIKFLVVYTLIDIILLPVLYYFTHCIN